MVSEVRSWKKQLINIDNMPKTRSTPLRALRTKTRKNSIARSPEDGAKRPKRLTGSGGGVGALITSSECSGRLGRRPGLARPRRRCGQWCKLFRHAAFSEVRD
jgi:hypothetical protein